MLTLLLMISVYRVTEATSCPAVAHLGSLMIRYADIACDAVQIRVRGRGHDPSVEESCRDLEQRRLEQKIREYLRPFAASKLHINVTDDQVSKWMLEAKMNDEGLVRASHAAALLPTAALHVLDGREIHSVWEEELSEKALKTSGFNGGAMTEEQFRDWMKLLHDRETILKMLRDSTVEATRVRLTELAHTELLNTKIAAAISAAAEAEHSSREVYSLRFWSDLATEHGVGICEQRFRLPDFRSFL
jgi:hypothetical protein